MSKNPFFISFFERSGSSFLVSLLNDHPNIACESEVFHMVKTENGLARLPEFTNREDVQAKLNHTYTKNKIASGFKFKYPTQYQLYPDVYEYLLDMSSDIRVIYLYRKNRLKAAISKQNQLRLVNKGKPSNLNQNNFVDLGKINLDIEKAFQYIDQREILDKKYYEELKHFRNKYVVCYEDLNRKNDSVMKEIYSFLKVDENYQPSAKTKKITNDNIQEAIANYAELIEKITGTKYEKYLEMSFT